MDKDENEATIGIEFQDQVHAAINDDKEENKVYDILKSYSESLDVEELVHSLRIQLADPNRLHLFEAVRPFVDVRNQTKYDRICPSIPGNKLNTVRLVRKGIADLGFHFRGGLEYGTGIFVSSVEPKSLADMRGLMPGDEIIRINGYDLSEALHSEVLELLKIRNQTIELKVRRMGMKPIRHRDEDKLIWTFVEGNKSAAEKQLERRASELHTLTEVEERDRKLHVSLEPGAKLGCGIGSNEEWGKGIFVCRVTPGSVSETLGFTVGDQVLEVNGLSYIDIKHEEAVMNLKTSRYLTVILRSREGQDGVFDERPLVAYGKPVEREPTPPAPPEDKIVIPVDVVVHNPEPLYAVVMKKDKKDYMYMPEEEEEDAWWNAEPETLFTERQIAGRELRKVKIVKDGPLNMFLEGGNKTPLGGKIVVSDVFPDGAADRCKQLTKGDQIMMCEGVNLIDVPLETAETTFKKHMSGPLDGSESIRLIIAATPPKDYEDEITFF